MSSIEQVYGDEGSQIIADAQAYVDGYNAYLEARATTRNPFTVNDVVATAAFIGSIFGAGGGGEASNAEFLSTLIDGLGRRAGAAGVGRCDAVQRPGSADHDR